MFPYEIYKLVHFVGIFMLFLGFGRMSSPNGALFPKAQKRSKLPGILHAVGLIFLIVGGFGMLARLEIRWPFPAWVVVKLGVWVLLGAALSVFKRKLMPAPLALLLVILLGFAAAYSAIYKPFLE